MFEGIKIEAPDPENPGKFIEVDPIINISEDTMSNESENYVEVPWWVAHTMNVYKDSAKTWKQMTYVMAAGFFSMTLILIGLMLWLLYNGVF